MIETVVDHVTYWSVAYVVLAVLLAWMLFITWFKRAVAREDALDREADLR